MVVADNLPQPEVHDNSDSPPEDEKDGIGPGKKKTVRKGHEINDPAGYPMTLHCEDEQEWKILLESYRETDGFSIRFNNEDFRSLPF